MHLKVRETRTLGSRLRIELMRPVKAMLDHGITACSPPILVDWIDHAHGDTMEQWVHFKSLPGGGTEIHTWADLMGPTKMIEGRDVCDVVTEFISSWYNRFAEECDQLAPEDVLCT